MNKILILLVFLISISGRILAQDTITVYYNINWLEISDKTDASFYRKAYLDINNTWTVNDYYISGKIQMTGTYKTKKLEVKHGHFIYYYENGNKTSEGDYIDDNNEGIWNEWYENGSKKSEGKFLKDKRIGVWNYWYESGKLKLMEVFSKGGSATCEGYFENGNLRYKGNYLYGQADGSWYYYNIDGRLFFKGSFNNGLRDGEWIRYFPDGQMIIHFKDGGIVNRQFGGVERNEK